MCVRRNRLEKSLGTREKQGYKGAVSGDGDTAQQVACLPSVHQVLCLIFSALFKLACNSST